MQAELSRQHLKVLRTTTEAATTFTLRSSLQQFFLWARAQHTTDSSENESYNRCQRICIQAIFKCGQYHLSIGADMEGQHQQWSCVGDAISRNTRSIIIRLNTRGSMAQGLSKIGGCSACGGSTPCPKMPCQGSERL